MKDFAQLKSQLELNKKSFFKTTYETSSNVFIALVLSGEIDAFIGGKNYHLTRGSFVLALPNEYVELNSPKGAIYWQLKLSEDLLSSTTQKFIYKNYKNLTAKLSEDDTLKINDYFSGLFSEHENFTEYSVNIFDKMAYIFSAEIIRRKNLQQIKIENAFYSAISFIHEKMPKTPELSVLSEISKVTENYFCALFKKKVGVTSNKYIKALKMNLAKNYLLATEKSVQDIAKNLDYSSFSHFMSDFKEVVKITPNNYRKNLQTDF